MTAPAAERRRTMGLAGEDPKPPVEVLRQSLEGEIDDRHDLGDSAPSANAPAAGGGSAARPSAAPVAAARPSSTIGPSWRSGRCRHRRRRVGGDGGWRARSARRRRSGRAPRTAARCRRPFPTAGHAGRRWCRSGRARQARGYGPVHARATQRPLVDASPQNLHVHSRSPLDHMVNRESLRATCAGCGDLGPLGCAESGKPPHRREDLLEPLRYAGPQIALLNACAALGVATTSTISAHAAIRRPCTLSTPLMLPARWPGARDHHRFAETVPGPQRGWTGQRPGQRTGSLSENAPRPWVAPYIRCADGT